jgi:hypothetical protein
MSLTESYVKKKELTVEERQYIFPDSNVSNEDEKTETNVKEGTEQVSLESKVDNILTILEKVERKLGL